MSSATEEPSSDHRQPSSDEAQHLHRLIIAQLKASLNKSTKGDTLNLPSNMMARICGPVYHPSTHRWVASVHSAGLSFEQKQQLEDLIFNPDQEVHGWLEDQGSSLSFKYYGKNQGKHQSQTSSPHSPPSKSATPFANNNIPHLNSPQFHRPSQVHQTSRYESSRQKPLKGIGCVICVGSGKGGVGKSTIAANLAVLLAQHQIKVGLLDADIHGPSAPQLLNINGSLGISSEDDHLIPALGHGVKCVSFGFLSDPQNPVVWRGPLISKALEQFLFEVHWGELDCLIIDLPPGTGDIPMTLTDSITIDGAIVVTTGHDIALLDAHKAISMFQSLYVPLAGVIGNMMTFHCGHCGEKTDIFGTTEALHQLTATRSAELLSQIPLLATPLQAPTTPRVLWDPVFCQALMPTYAVIKKFCHGDIYMPLPTEAASSHLSLKL